MKRCNPVPACAVKCMAIGAFAAGLAILGTTNVMAQPAVQTSEAVIESMRSCRSIADTQARAACYDEKVSSLLGALESGEMRLVDREAVRKTRRQLFGISAPALAMFGSEDGDAEEMARRFETTITGGRQTGATQWRFTTQEGATWEITDPPRKLKPIAAGDKVVFTKAALGYYFISINGQIAVKGRRVV